MTPLAENSLKSHKKERKTCRTHKTGINILVPHQVHKTSTPFSTYSTYCNVVFEGFEQLLSKTLVAKKRAHFLNVSRVLKQFILYLPLLCKTAEFCLLVVHRVNSQWDDK